MNLCPNELLDHLLTTMFVEQYLPLPESLTNTINSIIEVFLKDKSNVSLKDTSNVGLKDTSNVCLKDTSNAKPASVLK